MKKFISGVGEVDMTAEEIASREAEEQAAIGRQFPLFIAKPSVVASAMFTVTDGMLSEVDADSGLSMAFALGPGLYWLFFAQPQADKSFSVYPSASSGQINVTARELDYIELTVTEGGAPTDPAEFSVQIVRMR